MDWVEVDLEMVLSRSLGTDGDLQNVSSWRDGHFFSCETMSNIMSSFWHRSVRLVGESLGLALLVRATGGRRGSLDITDEPQHTTKQS
jgi:hypothetical protein